MKFFHASSKKEERKKCLVGKTQEQRRETEKERSGYYQFLILNCDFLVKEGSRYYQFLKCKEKEEEANMGIKKKQVRVEKHLFLYTL